MALKDWSINMEILHLAVSVASGDNRIKQRIFCCRELALAALLLLVPGLTMADGIRREVRDLHYGEVLFNFYNEDYFTAITQLLASKQLHRMPNHQIDSELLLGGLDLSYGLHQEAAQVFHRVLDANADAQVRNRAWYYLGKMAFQRGYLDEAEHYLQRLSGEVQEEVQGDRQLLLGQVLMAQARYADAANALTQWQGPEEWEPYADYNLGVALIHAGRTEKGSEILDQVGSMKADSVEQDALRDKANLALGFGFLKADQPARARPYLERVRLHGPYSNMALLGAGWADAQIEEYRKALTPWSELRGRKVIDASVQESMLAVPYVFARLNLPGQAANLYQEAIDAYIREMASLDSAIEAIREGNLVSELMRYTAEPEMGWFWRLKTLPDLPETRYLTELMADHNFQEALKNFRDLSFLQANLVHWAHNIDTFEDMLTTRRQRYEMHLGPAQQALAQVDFADIRARRDTLAARLKVIGQDRDWLGLANTDEQALWARLQMIEERLEAISKYPDIDELEDKLRMLKGVLIWQLNDVYAARLWESRKHLKQLDELIEEAAARDEILQRAASTAPSKFEGFDSRITGLRERIEMLRPKVASAVQGHGLYLQRLAVVELQRRKSQLGAYLIQARFSLGQSYDRAASRQQE